MGFKKAYHRSAAGASRRGFSALAQGAPEFEAEGPGGASARGEREKKLRAILEVILAVLLALSALGMAWVTWMSQLHGSNEAQKYALSTQLRTDGASMMSAANLELASAMSVWNELVSWNAQLEFYESEGAEDSAAYAQERIDYLIAIFCDSEIEQTVRDALAQDPVPYLFDDETKALYYVEAEETLAEADALIEEGKADSLHGDAFAFANVLYSIVLFLLASVGINKSTLVRLVLIAAGAAVFLVATVYTLSLPLPADFDLANYFQFLGSAGDA